MNTQLATNDTYFTEELVGISWIEFKLVYFKLKKIWLLFSNAKAKNPSSFFTSLDESMKPNLSQKAMKLAPNDNYMSIFVSSTSYFYIYTIFKVINKFENFFYKCASFVPVFAGGCHTATQSLK